jgi:nucleotidyltransferase/DNA polymerase involved in DNA repair
VSVAAIVIPHFALRVAVLQRPALDGLPLILGPAPGERAIVFDATPEAMTQGVRPGLGLREVVALCPEAVILAPHPVREHAVAEQVLTGLERLSPAVEVDPHLPGCYTVDLTGLQRRLGPPRQAAERLLATVPPLLRPRAGVAPNAFAARVAASQARAGAVQVVDAESLPALFARASIDLLPLDLATLRSLERMGVRTLSELAALSPAAVTARFGPAGRRAWELARGHDDTPVRARKRPEYVSVSLTLPAPATNRETLRFAITRLVLRAFAQPPLRHRHVRQVRLCASLEGEQSWEQVVTLREPGGRQRVIEALGYRIQSLVMPGPVEALTLELTGLIDATSQQERLPGFRSRRSRQLSEACRHLKQRFGGSQLYRVVEVEPWSQMLERQHALVTFEP